MARSSAKQHRKSGKKHAKRTMKGGEGTADNAIKVFGGMNDQHAVSNIDNKIAMNDPSAAPLAPAMQGGNVIQQIADLQKKVFGNEVGVNTEELAKLQVKIGNAVEEMKKGGGEKMQEKMEVLNNVVQNGGTGVLENIAVPAILLYANQKYSNKKRFANEKAKLRRTSRRGRRMRK
jgi:hypothetical protein